MSTSESASSSRKLLIRNARRSQCRRVRRPYQTAWTNVGGRRDVGRRAGRGAIHSVQRAHGFVARAPAQHVLVARSARRRSPSKCSSSACAYLREVSSSSRSRAIVTLPRARQSAITRPRAPRAARGGSAGCGLRAPRGRRSRSARRVERPPRRARSRSAALRPRRAAAPRARAPPRRAGARRWCRLGGLGGGSGAGGSSPRSSARSRSTTSRRGPVLARVGVDHHASPHGVGRGELAQDHAIAGQRHERRRRSCAAAPEHSSPERRHPRRRLARAVVDVHARPPAQRARTGSSVTATSSR